MNGYTIQWNISNKKDELLIHAASWINLKGIMLSERSQFHDSIYMTFLKTQNCGDGEQITGYQGLWVGRGCGYRDSIREFFGVMELFCILSMMVVTQFMHVFKFIELCNPTPLQESVSLYVNLKSETKDAHARARTHTHACLL